MTFEKQYVLYREIPAYVTTSPTNAFSISTKSINVDRAPAFPIKGQLGGGFLKRPSSSLMWERSEANTSTNTSAGTIRKLGRYISGKPG